MPGKLGVIRCEADAEWGWTCAKTAAWNLFTANGLTISQPDRRTLLVNVPEMATVHRYTIQDSGDLTEGSPIVLPSVADNIEWDAETGMITAGMIPIPGRPNEHLGTDTQVHGEVLGFKLPAEGSAAPVVFESYVRHDGSLLSQFSAGIRYGKAVLIGGPTAPGLLYCP